MTNSTTNHAGRKHLKEPGGRWKEPEFERIRNEDYGNAGRAPSRRRDQTSHLVIPSEKDAEGNKATT